MTRSTGRRCSRRRYLRAVGAAGLGSVGGASSGARGQDLGGEGDRTDEASVGYVTTRPEHGSVPPREPSVTDAVDGPLPSND